MALLSALSEMGLRLRLDVPDQAMEVATVFFRSSTPASEALVSIFLPALQVAYSSTEIPIVY